ncbi:hypothetical protein [Thiobacillus sp.]|uniref:hypothetical protein n=1 Tax=Thiobacillus sp. TaxID=924 RepID=UPI00286EA27E|nr:hypothetical protein [Thiobacillus sp.]
MAVDLAPFGRWTLRDESAPRRSPLRERLLSEPANFRFGSRTEVTVDQFSIPDIAPVVKNAAH